MVGVSHALRVARELESRSASEPIAVVDTCSGKGIAAMLLASVLAERGSGGGGGGSEPVYLQNCRTLTIKFSMQSSQAKMTKLK